MKPKFRLDQPFVFMVGIAALIHSTWTIATFSGGEAPNVTSDPRSVVAWLWWVVPGFLAAFALEVGQVDTARQIQRGQGRKFRLFGLIINVKVITFVVLSAATYLLQLVYLLHHFPERGVSSGLSEASKAAAAIVMEIVVWCSPLLLPLSMWMSVAGDEREVTAVNPSAEHAKAISIPQPEISLLSVEQIQGMIQKPFLSIPHPVNRGNGNHE